ncbi:MAG: helicase HerA-like domain-containing protein, partial [Pseudomonadota bacterium]
VTQNPDDVPEDILGQLGNRVQHALRAFTPRDQKALKAAAQTFRANERFDTAEAIREVGVGEALISTLQKKGVPGVVERVLVRPPSSRLGPLSKAERADVLAQSALRGLYDEAVDRESAYELLEKRAEAAAAAAEAEAERQEKEEAAENRASGTGRRYSPSGSSTRRTRSRSSDSIQDLLVKSAIRTVSTQSGRRFLRGMLGGLFKG